MTEGVAITPPDPATIAPESAPLKRVAIIGTAPSWKDAPWRDQTLEKWGLNDAYLIGVPEANRWYDLHPFHQMNFRPKDTRTAVTSSSVPIGSYLRPDGHLDWLRTRGFPVFLAETHLGWPATVQAFPKAAILQAFAHIWPMRLQRNGAVHPGPDYEVSTPSWMLMQAIVEGYREIHVYGIHLATSWEYQVQRPNFEFILGVASGMGIKVVLPQSAPICKASYQYAFEPKADLPIQQAEHEVASIKYEGLTLRQELAGLAWHQRSRRQTVTTRLQQLDIDLMDAKGILQRATLLLQATA